MHIISTEMGLGKTFVGSEKAIDLGAKTILVICQKSKVSDWIAHFQTHYPIETYDLTTKKGYAAFLESKQGVGVINYELSWRRPELFELTDFTLMLDESSLIQTPTAKRTKFILKLEPKNVILLSGTPTAGKYEKLWTQVKLLGWNIRKQEYDETFVNWRKVKFNGFPVKIVDKYNPYKNIGLLKSKLAEHGAIFMKSEEVLTLPEQIFYTVESNTPRIYEKFVKDSIVTIEGKDLIGDTILTHLLYRRLICGAYNEHKLGQFKDLISSTDDRVIVFYNFNSELSKLIKICDTCHKETSQVCGNIKDIKAYEEVNDSVTLVQYQAGSMGINFQKANKIIYFSPPLSCEHWMQSIKRIHRIGQKHPCFYYKMTTKNSVENQIYYSLEKGETYTNELFRKDSGLWQ